MGDRMDRAISRARAVGEAKDRLGLRATGVRYDGASGRVVMSLLSGAEFSFPAENAEGLRGAGPEDLIDVRVMPGGGALQWDRLDAGFTVEGLFAGRFGTERWMRDLAQENQWLSQAAAEMGRRGGSAVTEAKADAARRNGQRGGRPRKLRDGEVSVASLGKVAQSGRDKATVSGTAEKNSGAGRKPK